MESNRSEKNESAVRAAIHWRETDIVRTSSVLLIFLGLGRTGIAAQETTLSPGYQIRSSPSRIALDAKLTEPIWRTVDSITDFRQREPLEGAPATERTVVKLVRDRDRIYIAIRAFDTDISAVRSAQLRRDADLTTDDNVTVLIDSYRDRRGAFLFRVNPNGAMWDAQLNGWDNVNADWNGIWEVATYRDSLSWTVELAIPLRTLRFNPRNDAIGLNVRRVIRRKNEEDLWRSWGRSQGLNNLLNSGDVIGFVGVMPERPIELRPYMLARLVAPPHDAAGERLASGETAVKAGVDAKVTVTPTITGDLTVNTDFAQVEADQQVINLTRFPTFFPEKRAFFLESSGLFDLGTSGRSQLFYSRRIGIDSTGAPAPIIAGARVNGKAGPWGIGALAVRTGGSDRASDLVVRVGHDLLERSSVVGMAVNRSGPKGRDERGAGFDLDFPLIVRGFNIEPHFWMMGTNSGAAGGTPIAWRASTDFPNDLFDNFISVYSIDGGFNPTLGFVRRTGIRETTGHIDYRPRPGVLGIRQLELTPIPAWDIITERHENLARSSRWQSADLEWHAFAGELQTGDQFEVNVRRDLDAPADSFDIFRNTSVAPGRYWWTRGELQYATSSGRPLSAEAVVSGGQLYDGHSEQAELDATYRAGGHVIVGGSYAVTAARLRSGRFTAIETTGRAEYAFSTTADFLAFVQTQNEDRRIDFNLRFHWIPKQGDDVYVVWNSGFTTDPGARWRFPRAGAFSRPLNGAFVVKAVRRFSR
jgi:hypothetical protein